MASEAVPAERAAILALAARLKAALSAPEAETMGPAPVRDAWLEMPNAVPEMEALEAEAPDAMPMAGRLERMRRMEERPEEPAAVRLVFEPGPPVELEVSDDGFRGVLADAARDRVKVRLRYVKPGDRAPEERLVSPYRIVFAQGAWYVVGHDASRDDVRPKNVKRPEGLS